MSSDDFTIKSKPSSFASGILMLMCILLFVQDQNIFFLQNSFATVGLHRFELGSLVLIAFTLMAISGGICIPLYLWTFIALALAFIVIPVSMLASPVPQTGMSHWGAWVTHLLFFLCMYRLCQEDGFLRRLVAIFTGMCLLTACFVIVEKHFPGLLWQERRWPSASFINRNILASVMVCAILVGWHLASQGVFRVYGLVLIITCGYALLLSHTRGAFISGSLASATYLLFHIKTSSLKTMAKAALSAGVLVATIAIITYALSYQRPHRSFMEGQEHSAMSGLIAGTENYDASSHTRIAAWKCAWQICREHPLFGSGPGSFQREHLAHMSSSAGDKVHQFSRGISVHAHNDILELAADCGLPAAILFIVGLLSLPYLFIVHHTRVDSSTCLSFCVCASIIVHSLVHYPFNESVGPLIFWGACAIFLAKLPDSQHMRLPRVWSGIFALPILVLVVLALGIQVCSDLMFDQSRSQIVFGKIDSAKHHLETLLKWKPHDERAWNRLGWITLQQGNLDEARKALDKALRLHPHLIEARVNLAALALKRGDSSLAENHLDRALEVSPAHDGVLLQKANLLAQRGDEDGAEKTLLLAIGYHPFKRKLRVPLGELYEKQGRYEEACEQYLRCLDRHPDHLVSILGLARSYEKRSLVPLAIEWLEHAVERFPGHRLARIKCARLNARAGKYSRALEHYRWIVSKMPKQALWRFEKAMLHQHLGETRDMVRELQSFLGLAGQQYPGLQAQARRALAKQASPR